MCGPFDASTDTTNIPLGPGVDPIIFSQKSQKSETLETVPMSSLEENLVQVIVLVLSLIYSSLNFVS